VLTKIVNSHLDNQVDELMPRALATTMPLKAGA
jgi:hypothetical protein